MPDSFHLLDTFLSASPVVFYTVRSQPPFRHTFISRNIERLLGHSPDAFLANPDAWFQNIHPDDQPAVYSVLPQLYAAERLECEYRFRTAAGQYRWLRDEMCLMRDDRGRAVDIVGCWIDITTRKEAEGAQRTSEELFRGIFAQSPLAIELYDADGFLVDMNPASQRLFGVSDPSLVGRLNLFSDPYLPPEARQRILAGETLSFETAFDFDTIRARGRYKTTRTGSLHLSRVLAPWKMPGSDSVGFLMQVQDVTAQRRITEENQRLALVVQQTTNLVVITDAHRRIVWVNSAFEALTGYTLAEIVGRNPGTLLQGPETDAEEAARIRLALAEARPIRAELVNYSKSGSRYWIDVNIQPIFDANNQVSQFIAIETDISAKKLLEQDLIRAREAAVSANRAKSAFLASMSHEIRTPLNAILGFSQLLQRSSLSAQQLDQLGIIVRSGEHLLSVLNGIIELSKIEAGRMTLNLAPCGLRDLVDDVTRLLHMKAREKHLEFAIEGVERLPVAVVADAAKLRQLLINLLGNAIKFTAQGRVGLRLDASAGPDETSRIDIEVSDTGPGIAAEEMPLLFRHFSQTRAGRASGSGSGLGLAISREFARLMGGEITAESRLGAGSVFRCHVLLKVCADRQVPARVQARRAVHLEPGQPPLRILIVNNHDDSVLLLERMLEPLGFELSKAADPETAAAIADGWHPAVILVDHHFLKSCPDGFLGSLRPSPGAQATKILCCGSSGLAEERDAALAGGADVFLTMPILEADLLESLGELAGIRYSYTDDSGAPSLPAPLRQPGATSLAALPPELTKALREATLRADVVRITELLHDVESHDPTLADNLRLLAERFDYEQLLALLPQHCTP